MSTETILMVTLGAVAGGWAWAGSAAGFGAGWPSPLRLAAICP